MVAALAVGTAAAATEGVAPREVRHRASAAALYRALDGLGLRCHIPDPALRTPMLTSVAVPEGVDAAAVQRHLRTVHRVEIGGGLGPWKGRAWRLGLMGEGARPDVLHRLVAALGDALNANGHRCDVAAAMAAVRG